MTAGSGSDPQGLPGRHLVVMGVSSVGKSTVARALAERLGHELAEGDDFHPPANVAKMSAGVPLGDDDRLPWLHALARWAGEHDAAGRSTVMACSALKRSYRDVLRHGVPATCFVCLVGGHQLLLERMSAREHFMPPDLLDSQLADLEPLAYDESGIVVDVTDSPEQVVASVLAQLSSR